MSRRITLYVEGGGQVASGRAALRQGFDQLLAPQKQAAQARRWGWKLVPCGGRGDAWDAFRVAAQRPEPGEVLVLLVDAEGPVQDPSPAGRKAHLQQAQRSWALGPCQADHIHFMTQCMEAWLVADPQALAPYYGQGFLPAALPKRTPLDEEPKEALLQALKAASKPTRKGEYGKIKHASDLLKRVRPEQVAQRCRSFRDLTAWLDEAIAQG